MVIVTCTSDLWLAPLTPTMGYSGRVPMIGHAVQGTINRAIAVNVTRILGGAPRSMVYAMRYPRMTDREHGRL